MRFTETKLKGCFIIEPTVHGDHRGYFFESYNQVAFNEGIGDDVTFVQDNQSFSKYGTLRGLHFQKGEHAQAKLVRVISGEVLDVAIDLRRDSETYGEYISVILTADNKKQLYVPRGFAHGFATLSESAEFFYKCDNFYHKESEGGILYNDSDLNIDWMVKENDLKISDKDRELPEFSSFNN